MGLIKKRECLKFEKWKIEIEIHNKENVVREQWLYSKTAFLAFEWLEYQIVK